MFGDILPLVEAELSNVTNVPQVGAEIYTIPWGHIKVIVDKCKGDPSQVIANFLKPQVIPTIEHELIGKIFWDW